MNLLQGKTSIVTGANKGIGLEIVKTLARNGSNIIACSRKKYLDFESEIENLKNSYGIDVYNIYFDLEDPVEIRNAIKSIISLKQKIDILVNNAGYAYGNMFQLTPLSEIEKAMRINFISQIQFSQGISRIMTRNNSGSIINIGSVSGIIGDKGNLAYGASKAALMFATKVMASELSNNKIRVNSVAPSVIRTEMLELMDEKARELLVSASLLKKEGEVNDIANMVLFLASDLANHVNAQTIRVDGGIL